MSLGAEMAGVPVNLAVELDGSAFRTYARNHPKTLVLQADAQALLNLSAPLDPANVVVFGGPPCQGFSTSNQRTRGKKNQKNWLYKSFIGFVRNFRPGWVVFENVRGILETEKGHFAKQVEGDLKRLGYSVTSGVLNAADFGIPQIRSRFFLIGRLNGAVPQLPKPSAATKRLTVNDAIHDLPILRNGSEKTIKPYRKPAETQYARSLRGTLTE